MILVELNVNSFPKYPCPLFERNIHLIIIKTKYLFVKIYIAQVYRFRKFFHIIRSFNINLKNDQANMVKIKIINFGKLN